MKLLAGVLVGLMIGIALNFARAQSPDPCFLLTFTPSATSPQATLTTISLPSATLIPTLTRPALTPTYDFATHTIFQTATAIKQANLTQEAKWTLAAPFNTPSQEVWTETPNAPTPIQSASYRVVSLSGVNIRQLASINSADVGDYSYGQTVTIIGELVTQVVGGVTYKWGLTANGWVAVQVGSTILVRKQ